MTRSSTDILHFKARGRYVHEDLISSTWGEFVRYLEIAVDQRPSRQIDVFRNGKTLRYDRKHWCDEFGMLLCGRFSRKAKWARGFEDLEVLTAAQFEAAWSIAVASTLWGEQLRRSREAIWGKWM